MLSGVKILSRDQVKKVGNEEPDDSRQERQKSDKKKNKHRRKKNSRYSSSDDEEPVKSKRASRKKWYSSDEDSSLSIESSDDADEEEETNRRKRKKKSKKRRYSDDDEDDRKISTRKRNHEDKDDINIVRKDMGLEWMLRPALKTDKNLQAANEEKEEETVLEERPRTNPRELNPYLRDNGSGYPEEANEAKAGQNELLSSSVVGDGGASWRLKALKRAKEQAAREGRKLEEVVKERWSSLGHLATSVASQAVAPSRAHLHAIKSRKVGHDTGEHDLDSASNNKHIEKHPGRNYLKGVSADHPKMRAPKVHDSLSWKKRRGQNISNEDANLIASAMSSLNRFANDGNFLHDVMGQQTKASNSSSDTPGRSQENIHMESKMSEREHMDDKESLSANQLAAKVLQLRMKGKHDEAEKLLKETETAKAEQQMKEKITQLENRSTASRYVMHDIDRRQKDKEDSSDVFLAKRIMTDKTYSLSGRADDEYDFDEGPSSKKSRKKGKGDENKLVAKQNFSKRIATQQERCTFCFENANRPKHLVIAIANFTYLMLPQRQPVLPGHCCILTLQHESATRSVDDNVWEEIRNFKKCLIMMFAKQEKEVVFLETVMDIARQRRHCMIECVPLPQDVAKQAPVYFKKAIDEAEEEWSQHNAKKLIDTSQKGLRASIPKNFPYFHVEFGLNRGFVHVIDDETQFQSSFGLNVIRGMMKLAAEDMYRKRRYDTVESQKQAVAQFVKDWEPFDWTKQL